MHQIRLTFLAILLSWPALATAETLEQIVERAKPGLLGVAVYDFRTGQTQGVNLSGSFLLQSVFKVFLATTVLDRIDAGSLSLDQTVKLAPVDLRAGVGSIDNSKGGTFTVRALLKAAIEQSDNTAADALLRLVGGPPEVTAWLRRKGITSIRVDRDERTLSRDESGIPADFHPDQNAADLRDQISKAKRHAAFEAALIDPRDTATPEGTIHFLVALKEGSLLSPTSTSLLFQWMNEAKTGTDRLKAGFPAKTILAHKTGTSGTFEGISLATNDIGIATLPDGRTLAIAVFLANSPAPEETRDAIIAACAKAVSKSP